MTVIDTTINPAPPVTLDDVREYGRALAGKWVVSPQFPDGAIPTEIVVLDDSTVDRVVSWFADNPERYNVTFLCDTTRRLDAVLVDIYDPATGRRDQALTIPVGVAVTHPPGGSIQVAVPRRYSRGNVSDCGFPPGFTFTVGDGSIFNCTVHDTPYDALRFRIAAMLGNDDGSLSGVLVDGSRVDVTISVSS